MPGKKIKDNRWNKFSRYKQRIFAELRYEKCTKHNPKDFKLMVAK